MASQRSTTPLSFNGQNRFTGRLVLPETAAHVASEDSLPELFEKVERAKHEWEVTADALPELICLLDDQGCVVRANRTVETWGIALVTSVHGRNFHQLIHPDCASPFCHVGQFLNNGRLTANAGQPSEFETYDRLLNRHLQFRIQPVTQSNTSTPVTVVVVQDISKSKQAEESVRRYTRRLEATAVIARSILAAHSSEEIAKAALSLVRMLVPFRQAYMTLFNSESNELLVLTADANGGTHLRPGRTYPATAFDGGRERQLDQFFMAGDLLQLTNRSDFERQLLKEGIGAYFSIPLVAEGEFVGSIGFAANQPYAFNPEHIEIAREIANLLAIAIYQSQLFQKLQRAHTELHAALRTRDDVLRNVSHELRTPLSLIYGYTALLEDGELGPLVPEQARALLVMREQQERLCFMVDRLLILRKFDAINMPRLQLAPEVWLRQVVGSWEARAARSGVRLQLDISPALPAIRVSPDHMKQVIDNLLDNAVKFSPRGGTVRVRARAESDQVVVAITDEGIGIPLDKIKQVFDLFYQVDGSQTRQFGGMGIGLALCQEIVEAHSGRIWAESAGESQGSTFYVALPVDRHSEGNKG